MSTPKLAIPDLTQTAGLTAYLSCNEGFIKLDAFLHGCTIKDRDRTIPPNETQTLTITGTPTGGTFTLLYVDQTTSAIAYNASAATVDAALEALSNIGAGDVTCAGGPLPGTPVTIQFTGALAGGDRALLVPNTAGLTGGTVPAATVTTTTPFAVAGDLYLVAASPTGDWTGKAGKIALFGAVGTWYFIDPIEGMEIWVQDEDLKLYYDGAAWVQAPYKRVAADVDITDSSGGTASSTIALATNTGALTDSSGGTANTTLEVIADAPTANNFADIAAQLAIQRALNTVLINGVASLAAEINDLRGKMRTAGVLTP